VQVVVTPVRVVEVGSPASTRRGARSPGTPKVQRPAPRLATTPVEQTSAHVSSPPASQVPAAPAASVPVSRTRSAHRPPSRSRDVRTTAAAPPAVRRAEPRWSRPAATLSEPGTSRGSGLTLTALGGGLASLLGGVALLAVLLRHRTRPPAPGGGVVVPLRPLGAIREERCGRRAA